MTKIHLLCTFALLYLASLTQAQTAQCGQQRALHQLEKQYSNLQKAANATFEAAKESYRLNANRRRGVVHQVEVVVHVVYNAEEQNISDELIHSQIEVLNEDFRRLNADAENARDIYKSLGGDAEIEFVLASVDPDGNPTNGITRTQTAIESFMDVNIEFDAILGAAEECDLDISNILNIPDSTLLCLQQVLLEGSLEETSDDPDAIQLDDVKRSDRGGIDPWDTERYINIWVTNLNMNFMGQEVPALLGFAYPPVGAPNWPDEVFLENLSEVTGVVVHHQAFGRNNPNTGALGVIADGGGTCTHEMGHYFGLRHVHGDGACDSDDGISDTPVSDANQQAQPDPNTLPVCSDLHNIDTCPEDDLPDMVENYMDYNAITCQNLFTIEQVGIMRAMLEGPRSGLIQTTTSTASALLNQSFSIYPNPTSDEVFLRLEGYDIEDFEVRVQNTIGQTSNVQISNNNQIINLSSLPEGIYIVQIVKENLVVGKKVSILR